MFVRWEGRARNQVTYVEARRLREEKAMPFKQIASRLDISVATAHLWTKDIVLSPGSIERNLRGPSGPQSPERIAARVDVVRREFRARRATAQEEGRAKAREGDAVHQAGCMLYWAEGAKSRNTLDFANSDAPMVRFFCHFLRKCFGVPVHRLTVRLNVYLGNGLSIGEIEAHWLELLELPRTSLRKHIVNHFPTSSSGLRKNKLPYGVCSLRVLRSTPILQHIYGAIQEYAGFEEPRWLDCNPLGSEEAASN